MSDTIDDIKETGKGLLNDAKEVIKQRFFSPMYFYFLLSWIITNWKFVFALFFIDSDDIFGEKLDYLVAFYPVYGWTWLWTLAKLIFIPAFSAFVFVWWFSKFSEKFYERNETFKLNKQTIKRKLDYEDKVKIAEEKRKIRDSESDKEEIRYNDHEDFNSYIDEPQENIKLLDSEYLPSEVLYNTDPESYKEKLNQYLAEEGIHKIKY